MVGAMLGAVLSPQADAAACTIERLPQIPVTMAGRVPLMHVQVNGADALFVADSGAFFSIVTPGSVAELKLSMDPAYHDLFVQGIGGLERAEVVRARTLTLMNNTWHNVPFIVAGRRIHGAAGLLGQNFFHMADTEYDLANGVIRLVKPKGCKDQPLAYWAAAADKHFSVIDIEFANAQQPHTKATAYLNGRKIAVLFDTGADRSMLTVGAAKAAGIAPQSAGVESAGEAQGIGSRVARSWVARFDSFKIGDEETRNARLRIAEVDLLGADMLLGADFFLSHRIYVATSQRKLYFTYNGGPVFDLERARASEEDGDAGDAGSKASAVAGEAPSATAGQDAPPPPATDADLRLDRPTDAAGFARRGQAAAARHDYALALADLDRACQMAPHEASYFYERALVHFSNRQGELGAKDLDQALTLQPDHVQALMARASMRFASADKEGSVRDLEAADRAASTNADEHLALAALYESIGQPDAARLQYSKWIQTHGREDTRMPQALNGRCWAGALAGEQLEQARADCDAALRSDSKAAAFLDSRGLVNLRLGNYKEAIKDYDAALRLNPKIAWSLYGRGLAKLRTNQSASGQADIEAAKALQPGLPERASKFGIAP